MMTDTCDCAAGKRSDYTICVKCNDGDLYEEFQPAARCFINVKGEEIRLEGGRLFCEDKLSGAAFSMPCSDELSEVVKRLEQHGFKEYRPGALDHPSFVKPTQEDTRGVFLKLRRLIHD